MTQSQKRSLQTIGALFQGTGKETLLFLKSSSDVGVIRNGGRNGAKYAPQSLLSQFKRLNQDEQTKHYAFIEAEATSQEEEELDFDKSQVDQTERIKKLIDQHPNARLCHLGGGHDHVYPLLMALSFNKPQVIVINIDAHADTRTDINAHSGTPFRQFADHYQGEFHLFQIGLHRYANPLSNFTPLGRGKMHVLWREEVKIDKLRESFFQSIQSIMHKDTIVLFSLDADALDGSEVPGVSAVNPQGLYFNELLELWNHYRSLKLSHRPVLGIYELNPAYDSISMLSMRKTAAFLYQTLQT